MQTGNFRKTLCAGLLVVASVTTAAGQKMSRASNSAPASGQTMLRIICGPKMSGAGIDGLASLLGDKDVRLRKRAALALGRIGDERALPKLSGALQSDKDIDVRQMCAFAIGEIESTAGTEALIAVLDDTRQPGAGAGSRGRGAGKDWSRFVK